MPRRRHVATAVISEPYDEGLGHSFGYIRLDALATAASTASSKIHHSEKTTTFRTISDASVSANTATSLSTPLPTSLAAATAFESSTSFSFVPLQPVPRFSSRPLSGPFAPVDREFFSGPIERGFSPAPSTTMLHLAASPGVAPMASPFAAACAAPPLPSSTASPEASPAQCCPPSP